MSTDKIEFDHAHDDFTLYQMMVMHQDHGRSADEHPVYDLGIFTPKKANQLANFLIAVCGQMGLDPYNGEVHNICEAWGSMEYRCWLLPVEEGGSCLELCAEGIVEVSHYHDPR